MYRRPYFRTEIPVIKAPFDDGGLDPCPWGVDPLDVSGLTPVCANSPDGSVHCIPCHDPNDLDENHQPRKKCCLKSPEDYNPYLGDQDVTVDDVPTLCPWGEPTDGTVCQKGCFVQDKRGGVKGRDYEVQCCNEDMAKAGELEYDFTSVCDPKCEAQSGLWPTGCIYCPARNTGEGNFVACKGADDTCTTRLEHCSVFAPTKWYRKKDSVDDEELFTATLGSGRRRSKRNAKALKLSQEGYSAALSNAYARHVDQAAAIKHSQQRAALAASALAAASRLHFWGF
jgi:hypothetical protein